MTLAPLRRILIEPLVRATLLEDLGRAGDLTTDAIVPAGLVTRAALVAREHGVIAGLDLARLAFQLIDPDIALETLVSDGASRHARPSDCQSERLSARDFDGRTDRAQFSRPSERNRDRHGVPRRGGETAQRQKSSARGRRRLVCAPSKNTQSGPGAAPTIDLASTTLS